MYLAAFILLGLLSTWSEGAYVLEDNYTPDLFFSMFSFSTVSSILSPPIAQPIDILQVSDPNSGYVTFVDEPTAFRESLINNQSHQVHIGVDSTNIASGTGRSSVKIISNKSYNRGLFILDLAHMPGSICGVWPA